MERVENEIIEDLLSFDDLAVFMRAYLDESGLQANSDAVTMAGIVASGASWKALQTRWMKALHRLKIQTPFHATDCEAAKNGSQFEGMERERRDEIQATLIATMRGLDIIGGASSVLRKDYTPDVAAALRQTAGYRHAWYLAFEMVIGEVMVRTQNQGKPHALTFVFDLQDQFSPLAHDLYKEIRNQDPKPTYVDRMGTLAFSPKDNCALLQAVDLILYETHRHIWESRLQGNIERWQNKRMRQTIDIDGVMLDGAGLHRLRHLVAEDRGERNAV